MKQSGIIALFLIIFLLILAILGTFYWYKSYYLKPQTISQKPTVPAPTLNPNSHMFSIDFASCQPMTNQIDVALGSTTYQIVGKSGSNCLMNYGGEVENPRWDGKLPNHCKIPLSLGSKSFYAGNMGVDFTSISKYCS